MSAPATDTAKLWVVRHARVAAPPGLCYGQLDLAADEHATWESAQALAKALPAGLKIMSSPLQRCEQLTLALIALRPDLPVIFDCRLREMHFGQWEGRRWDHIPRAEIEVWSEALAEHAPGGGECLRDMLARVHAALRDAARESQGQSGAETGGAARDIVWIAHAGVARCVQWLIRPDAAVRSPSAAEWPLEAPAPGTWAHYPLRCLGEATGGASPG